MQLEAPGTYHHSLVVAQLSENACNAIGANPLLARACALFHDIGKTPTRRTSPRTSATAAIPTTRRTRRVGGHHPPARGRRRRPGGRHHLPRAVIDVIRQHHGTTLVKFFYERALALSQSPFPGVEPPPCPTRPSATRAPKPQFKESAVVSLADGVEAVTRSVRTITAEKLGALIDRLIADRVADGQLDEAPLTFEDLAKIKNSFTFTLLNMLHSRVAYIRRRRPARPRRRHEGRRAPLDVAIRHPRLKADRRALAAAVGLLDGTRGASGAAAPPGELSVAFLTDGALARLHGRFLDDPSPTDVITFAGRSRARAGRRDLRLGGRAARHAGGSARRLSPGSSRSTSSTAGSISPATTTRGPPRSARCAGRGPRDEASRAERVHAPVQAGVGAPRPLRPIIRPWPTPLPQSRATFRSETRSFRASSWSHPLPDRLGLQQDHRLRRGDLQAALLRVRPGRASRPAGLEAVWDILATLIVMALVTLLGYVSRYVFGKFFFSMGDRFIQTIPGVSAVYNTVRQIVNTFSSQSRHMFNKVVLVEFPRKGCWTIGFLTNTVQGEAQEKAGKEVWTCSCRRPRTRRAASCSCCRGPRSSSSTWRSARG
jgi:putative nucleotidyltransferase with HDIG domain